MQLMPNTSKSKQSLLIGRFVHSFRGTTLSICVFFSFFNDAQYHLLYKFSGEEKNKGSVTPICLSESVGGAKDANQLALSCKCADSLGRQECGLLAFAACSRFMPHDGRKKNRWRRSQSLTLAVSITTMWLAGVISIKSARHVLEHENARVPRLHCVYLSRAYVTGRRYVATGRGKKKQVNKEDRRGSKKPLSVERFVNYLFDNNRVCLLWRSQTRHHDDARTQRKQSSGHVS